MIRRFVAYQERGSDVVHRCEVPTGGMSLVLSFGPTMRVNDKTVSSFFIGMWDEPAVTEHDGIADGVQIDLSVDAAYALAGAPMDELTNRVVEVEALDTVDVDRLLNRLLDTPSLRVAAGGARRGNAGRPTHVGRGAMGAPASDRSSRHSHRCPR